MRSNNTTKLERNNYRRGGEHPQEQNPLDVARIKKRWSAEEQVKILGKPNKNNRKMKEKD